MVEYLWEAFPMLGVVSTILSLILMMIIVLRTIRQSKADARRANQQPIIQNSDHLYMTVRSQLHDYSNHLQVIFSFLKLRKMDELERYIQELVSEISEINELIQIGHPALAALIQSKINTSKEHNVQFDFHFTNLEPLTLGVKSIDLVKIAANLIDNALDEAKALPLEQRTIEIIGWTADNTLHITVRNFGRVLTAQEIDNIFTPGYSTKNNDQHVGIGLAIVKERVEFYNGNVEVESCPTNGTTFRVKIPLLVKFSYA